MSFLFLSANTPWVYALAKNLANHSKVTAVRLYDWANYRRLTPAWPEERSDVRRLTRSLPAGYAGKFEPLFRRFMQAFVARELASLGQASGGDPIVICPYPYLAPWVRRVPGDRLIYYNLDDYSLYAPAKAARTRALEDELVERSGLTICLSVHQVQNLRRRVPEASERVVHFPLGVVDEFINRHERSPREAVVGYVGNLTDRVDWKLVAEVAKVLPGIVFKFVGSLGHVEADLSGATWEADRRSALTLPNVHHVGPVPQGEVASHYWRYAINWMPYDSSHPFNIASCPTKIMDALASGRPFISTPIPEVELYASRIHIIADAPSIARKIQAIIGGTKFYEESQVAFAATQTWDRRSQTLRSLINTRVLQ